LKCKGSAERDEGSNQQIEMGSLGRLRRPPAGAQEGGVTQGSSCRLSAGAPLGRRARLARALAGFAFLLLAGALASRSLPGGIALWPLSLVPAWFGISHLVASMTGYRGCPELGAIPSVWLGRPVGTGCGPWDRIDRLLTR
jgi:hypothetical protein